MPIASHHQNVTRLIVIHTVLCNTIQMLTAVRVMSAVTDRHFCFLALSSALLSSSVQTHSNSATALPTLIG